MGGEFTDSLPFTLDRLPPQGQHVSQLAKNFEQNVDGRAVTLGVAAKFQQRQVSMNYAIAPVGFVTCAVESTKYARKLSDQLAGVRFLVRNYPLAMLGTSLVECFVSTGIAGRSVNQLLVVLLDKIAGRQTPPAAGVETEDVLEVGSLFDPVIHHFCEGWSLIGVDAGRAVIEELTNDFDSVFGRPLANLFLLFRK